MLGQATDRICGSCFFTEDLVPWTQQELSKVHAKAAMEGTPTSQGGGVQDQTLHFTGKPTHPQLQSPALNDPLLIYHSSPEKASGASRTQTKTK